MSETNIDRLKRESLEVRRLVLDMAFSKEGAHLGGSLSATDILCVLYNSIMRVLPDDPNAVDRDHFILSKGHSCAALYAILARKGFFPPEELRTYACSGGRLGGHPSTKLPGIEAPTGSLGHGLSLGVGLALAAKRDNRSNKVFVLLGDGEQQEGTVWEAALSASRYALSSLIAITDRNSLQINGETEAWLPRTALADRWRSFGWSVLTCDGHDHQALVDTLEHVVANATSPTMLIAETTKAKGVSFMEGRKKSHYVTLTQSLHRRARRELERASQC